MNNNVVQRTDPIFVRLDEAIREVRKATKDEADVLAAAMGLGTPASFASVQVAHLNLIDTVHRLVLLIDVARRETSRPTAVTPLSPRPTVIDASTPVSDPFAVLLDRSAEVVDRLRP